MATTMREKGHQILDHVPDEQLPTVVRWLELLAKSKDHPDIEPEELWLLASGELEQMADEAEHEAQPLDNWRQYLDEL
jgi:hypothetical protein